MQDLDWHGLNRSAAGNQISIAKQCGEEDIISLPNFPVSLSIIIVMNALRAVKATSSTSRVLLAARAASTTASPIRSSNSAVPLANVEAQWNSLTAEEQVDVHRELEELQKRDWKTLSLDEKKAGELVPNLSLLDFFTPWAMRLL